MNVALPSLDPLLFHEQVRCTLKDAVGAQVAESWLRNVGSRRGANVSILQR